MPASTLNINGVNELDLNLLGTTALAVSGGVATITQTVTPTNLPIADTPAVAHEWFNSYSSTTGTYTQTQPLSTDLGDSANVARLNAAQTFTSTVTATQFNVSANSSTVAGITVGSGTSVTNFIAISAGRGMLGFNNTTGNVVVQGGAGKGIDFNVANATFGSGRVGGITNAGVFQFGSANQFTISAAGVVAAPSPTFTGTATVQHLAASGSTPTIAAGSGAGTGATVSISGTDTTGVITVTTGTSPATSVGIFTATFAAPFSAAPNMFINAANADGTIVTLATAERTAALSGVQAVCVNTTTTVFAIISNGTPLAASTTYAWQYWMVQP